jgi:uncharacterized membrane protein (DUF485 family)
MRKQRTFSSAMLVIFILLFVVSLMLVSSMSWMFTQTQMDIAIMAMLLAGVGLFIFQGKL